LGAYQRIEKNKAMDLEKWVNEFPTLETEEQKANFDKRFKADIDSLSETEREKFSDTFYNAAVKEVDQAKNFIKYAKVRMMLEPIINYISLAEIARSDFNKTRQWLYMKLNGNTVNGKIAEFTNNEIGIMADALQRISTLTSDVAKNLKEELKVRS
jgi:oligoendopeptidase F